ncbi:acyl-CoA dehydrogenase family protein [Nocardioides sp. cx-173]|uniref:acyl-CoA dehydrogenase family protein n=1 Tax=Nocardioides sp. cx-173 TaxID=2898796 RepID=UPI001E5E0C2B|nr:acyl-CoA dehydrogenase family protein [Nocardioides sp. cx-173]MCD4526599.1 acyl-CoA/acyl-ACP dehydrogenase [Nocardioides sp. cx-173]UGB40694.1 acyl-CoA/acyl-ACP dehydrogenase [Nocardioides sp. cx-173]
MAKDWLADDLITEEQESIRDAVSDLAQKYPQEYWTELDRAEEYPDDWVKELTDNGWLSMLIPEEYGGGGATINESCIVLETLNRWGNSAGLIHAQMYQMGAVLRHGSDEQKQKWLPQIANEGLRLQSFGVTEPDAGTDTTRIRTFAKREGDHYIVNGGKIFTSRFLHTDLMLLLVRTERYEDVEKKTDGISVLLVDVREAKENGQIESRPIKVMSNHETNQLTFTNLKVPVENLIGEEGKGFKVILSGMNSERVSVASEYIGAGLYFIDRSVGYSKEREVFGKLIGSNQGIQFPIAQAYVELKAASVMRWEAARLYAAGSREGFYANACKFLAADAQWKAANAAMDTFGGYGLTEEFGIARKFQSSRGSLIAPISRNLILAGIAQRELGMPRSY